jgi:hypothetical protein
VVNPRIASFVARCSSSSSSGGSGSSSSGGSLEEAPLGGAVNVA